MKRYIESRIKQQSNRNFLRSMTVFFVLLLFRVYRNTTMAASTNSANKERTGPSGPVPVDLPGHHCPEAANRGRRQQGWPLQIRQARQIGHQVEICSCLTIQLPSARPQGFRVANHREAIALSSRKILRTCLSFFFVISIQMFKIWNLSFFLFLILIGEKFLIFNQRSFAFIYTRW